MTRRNSLLSIATLLLVAALGVWAWIPAAIEVDAVTIKRGAFEVNIDEQAKTRLRNHYLVTAPLAGTLERITLTEGDDVADGLMIARMLPVSPTLHDVRTEAELRGRLEAAKAARESAEVRLARGRVALAQAKVDLERSQKLVTDKLVSQAKLESDELAVVLAGKEVDAAQAQVHVAIHDIDVARAALASIDPAVVNSERTVAKTRAWPINAPIAGRVLRVIQKSGGTVAVGTPLMELGNPDDLEVVSEMLTSEAPRISEGAQVTLDGWGGKTLGGRVRRIEPQAFTKISALGVEEQRVNVLIDIVSPRADWSSLAEGYRIDVHIRVYHQEQALLIPTASVFRTGLQWSAFAIDGGNRARLTEVTLAQRGVEFTEVVSGLSEGERVIVYPGDAIKDGVRVVVRRPN